ncbi:MAG: hypothetical protein ABIV36_24650 [Sphingobium limneticum]
MTVLQLLRFVPALLVELLAQSVRWLAERPVRLVIVGLLLLGVWLWIAGNAARDLAEDRRVQAAAWHGKFAEQKAEMQKFGALVAAAQAEAIRSDRVNKVRVQGEVAYILQEQTHGYQADLAAARADYARWVRERRAGGEDSADRIVGQAGMSSLSALSPGALRACPEAALDDAEADAVIDNTLRLERIIAAWGAVSAIDVNGR